VLHLSNSAAAEEFYCNRLGFSRCSPSLSHASIGEFTLVLGLVGGTTISR
jgi:hypothetical protein